LNWKNWKIEDMSRICIALTKKGQRCKNTRKNTLFCGVHIKSVPTDVILEIDGIFIIKNIKFTNETDYMKIVKDSEDNETARIKKEAAEIQDKIAKYELLRKCIVCYEEVQFHEDLMKCSSSNYSLPHLVCQECLKSHCVSMLTDGIANLDCMFDKADKCGGCYKEYDILKILGTEKKDIVEKWRETLINNEIVKLASICDNYIICPLCCAWGCIFEVPANVDRNHIFYIQCGKCNKTWCIQCKRKSHGNRSCYNLHFEENENDQCKIQVIDRMLQDITTKSLTHCCSICGCTYIKEEGCNLMTCPKCNGMSCYICGMKLYIKNNTKYWHFTGHHLADRDAQCPLWNNKVGDGKANQGNTDYNMKKVEREIINFITHNIHKHPNDKSRNGTKDCSGDNNVITNLIKTRIIALFGKDKDYNKIIELIMKMK
jgi:hypothetical protein